MTVKISKTVKTIDEALDAFSGFGLFQLSMCLVCSLNIMPIGLSALVMYFGALSPEWQCAQNSTTCTSNTPFPYDDDVRCFTNRTDWEFTKPKHFSIATEFELVCNKKWLISLLSSMYFVGSLLGGIIMGWASDTFGRKRILFLSTAVVLLTSFAISFSPNLEGILVLRLVAGFFMIGTPGNASLLATESVSRRYRAFVGQIIFFMIPFTESLVALTAYYTPKWRMFFVLSSVPYIFILFFYPVISESVRWLQMQGQTKEIDKFFNGMSKWNKESLLQGIETAPNKPKAQHKRNRLNLFKNKKLVFKAMLQCYGWMVIGTLYFGLSLAADKLGGSVYLNFVLLSTTEIPAIISSIYFCNKIGRKKTVMVSLMFAGIGCVLLALLTQVILIEYAPVIVAMVGRYFVAVSLNGEYTWTAECFPTEVSGEAFGLVLIGFRIGGAIASFIVKLFGQFHSTVPFLTMACLAISALLLFCLLPETKNKSKVENLLNIVVAEEDIEDTKDLLHNKTAE